MQKEHSTQPIMKTAHLTMSIELLRMVLANPGDIAARLSYADRCAESASEADRARAGFIRGQIQLTNSDLDFLSSADGQRLHFKLADLLQRFGDTWRAPLSRFGRDLQFRNGFVECMNVKAATLLHDGDEIFGLAPIRHMDLTDVRDVDESLFSSPHLFRLQSLGLDGCGLYNFHIRLLLDSHVTANLRWLSLEHNHLDLGAAEALAQSPDTKNLQFVELNGNPVNPCEQMGWDSGALIDLWMPPEGEDLEKRFGVLPWLHRTHGVIDRFDA